MPAARWKPGDKVIARSQYYRDNLVTAQVVRVWTGWIRETSYEIVQLSDGNLHTGVPESSLYAVEEIPVEALDSYGKSLLRSTHGESHSQTKSL